MKKYAMSEHKGYEVVVDIEGDVTEYALNFLAIFNNVRENRELILTKNYPGNNLVSLVCTEESLEETKRFLSQFGKIYEVLTVKCLQFEDFITYKNFDDVVILPEYMKCVF